MVIEFEDGAAPLVPEYVLGFVFSDISESETGTEVILILKNKPDYQKGKLNGIGGKIEPNEGPLEAMRREYEEEAGVATGPLLWCKVGRIYFPLPATVHLFAAQSYDVVRCSRTETDEHIIKMKVKDIRFNPRMVNLDWIIPLCMTALKFPFTTQTPWTPLDIRENWN